MVDLLTTPRLLRDTPECPLHAVRAGFSRNLSAYLSACHDRKSTIRQSRFHFQFSSWTQNWHLSAGCCIRATLRLHPISLRLASLLLHPSVQIVSEMTFCLTCSSRLGRYGWRGAYFCSCCCSLSARKKSITWLCAFAVVILCFRRSNSTVWPKA